MKFKSWLSFIYWYRTLDQSLSTLGLSFLICNRRGMIPLPPFSPMQQVLGGDCPAPPSFLHSFPTVEKYPGVRAVCIKTMSEEEMLGFVAFLGTGSFFKRRDSCKILSKQDSLEGISEQLKQRTRLARHLRKFGMKMFWWWWRRLCNSSRHLKDS